MKDKSRFIQFDILRGFAVLLVFFRHAKIEKHLTNFGWLGVDLFFVLSGFLISRLLFQEFEMHNNIHPFRFLIRRAFKILPLFYLTYLLYVYPVFLGQPFEWVPLWADLLFFQNYVSAWGYANMVSWSLAIEEHFYLLLTFSFTLLLPLLKNAIKIKFFPQILVALILMIELGMRIYFNTHTNENGKNFTMTHLRLDGLALGVFIGWLYQSKKSSLINFHNSLKYFNFIFIAAALIPFFFIEPIASFYVRTAGFTLSAISFALLLIAFLPENLSIQTSRTFSISSLFSFIGKHSYAFYLVHLFCIRFVRVQFQSDILFLIVSFLFSVFFSVLITRLVEIPLLNLRDKYFPSRTMKTHAG